MNPLSHNQSSNNYLEFHLKHRIAEKYIRGYSNQLTSILGPESPPLEGISSSAAPYDGGAPPAPP